MKKVAVAFVALSLFVAGYFVERRLARRHEAARAIAASQQANEDFSYGLAQEIAEYALRVAAEDQRPDAERQLIRARDGVESIARPFLIAAENEMAKGNFKLALELCTELVQRFPRHTASLECVQRAQRGQ